MKTNGSMQEAKSYEFSVISPLGFMLFRGGGVEYKEVHDKGKLVFVCLFTDFIG